MAREVWSTYSVRDHLSPRSLAADVMMFDRLLFPVPELGAYPPFSSGYDPTERVVWRPNPTEWARWEAEEWRPEEQQTLLEILAPVAWKAAWSNQGELQRRYAAEAAQDAAHHLFDDAFSATRTLLTQGLPAYVEGVASIGPAFRSLAAFEAAVAVTRGPAARLPGQILTNVIAAEWLVPDPDDPIPTETLLRETVDFVAGDKAFRNRRTAFNEWQQRFVSHGVTDPASVRKAVEEMHDLLHDARTAAARLKVRKCVKNVFKLAPAGLGFVAAVVGDNPAFAVGGAFISVGEFAVDEWLFKDAEQATPAPAVFILDASRHLGWKPD